MGKITNFYTSSVGRKLLVGLTGFFLSAFLAFHLTINLFLFKQDAGKTFNDYSEFLATYPLLRPIEIVLFLLFVVHAFLALWLWFVNRRARPRDYEVLRASDNSKLESRVTFITGSVVLIFLVVHINTFFVTSRFFAAEESVTMYQRVANAFQNPWYVAFYVVALAFLAYHLKHGFQSMFQTFGLRSAKYQRLIDVVAIIFWLLIPLGFAAMPLYFLFRVH
ncbi:MAG: succinate dehydrogenase [Bacteroidetes bacterium]|nr:succinate dehydrogenase [Bacteroidota bacterium]